MQVTVIESCILIMFHLIFAREFERDDRKGVWMFDRK